VARPAADHELSAFAELLSESRGWYVQHEADAKDAIGDYAVDGVPPPENAAWIATLRIMLNLDEFLTRE
jgi:hypothetical protein